MIVHQKNNLIRRKLAVPATPMQIMHIFSVEQSLQICLHIFSLCLLAVACMIQYSVSLNWESFSTRLYKTNKWTCIK